MKQFVFVVLLSLTVFSHADITVKSFRKLENDMTARVNASKKDKNGDVCALIKVVTTQTGFIWEPDQLGIVSAENTGGEYWIYLPYSAKRITIKHPLLGVLRDYMYPMPIEKATVYEMVLTTNNVDPGPNLIESQWLFIKTTPANALIYIDDRFVKSGGEYSTKIKPGNYIYRVEAPLYHTEAGTFEITDLKKTLSVDLKPAFGYLQINSSPEQGATVLIDGKTSGLVTPFKTDAIASGEHTLQVLKEMYIPANLKIVVSDGQTTPVNVVLQPNFAELSINAPQGASLFVNNIAKASGSWNGRLSAGVYTIEARMEKYRPARQDIELNTGDKKTINLQPTPIYGAIDINSSPAEATITIDGKTYGTTPNTVNKLLIGDYTVQLSKPGFTSVSRTVTITDGKTSELFEKLTNGREITIRSTPAGANLFIDNQKVGTTPYTGNLTFGTHKLQIEHNGKQAEKTVSIAQNGGSTIFELSFVPANFTETIKGVTFDMVAIKGGTFEMGSNDGDSDEKPVTVTVSDFYMGKTEVTFEQFKIFVDDTAYKTDAEKGDGSYIFIGGSWSKKAGVNWRHNEEGNPRTTSEQKHPVIHVSWNDADAYCKWLTEKTGKKYRLPTEAEWEYAAGNGIKHTKFSWGNTMPTGRNGGNVADETAKTKFTNWTIFEGYTDGYIYSSPVASFNSNELGLYDMSGNVWEWCNDRYGNYSSSPQTNPTGPSDGSDRVGRGGGWDSGAQRCRVANRRNLTPGLRFNALGFRLVFCP